MAKNPREMPPAEKPQDSNMEELKIGKFSLTPEEEEFIRKRAEARGEDAEAAVEAAREKIEAANRRMREIAQEKAIKETEAGMSELAGKSPEEMEEYRKKLEEEIKGL
jgi:hypothetical protein